MSEVEQAARRLPWGESPYDQRTPAEVVHDYAVVRGDLSEQHARDQLAEWIERYADHRAEETVTAAGSLLLQMATEDFERKGPDDRWASAVWACAVWLNEGEAIRELRPATPADSTRAVGHE